MGFKIVIFDIECWDFKADNGILLLSGFKEVGKKPIIYANKKLVNNLMIKNCAYKLNEN